MLLPQKVSSSEIRKQEYMFIKKLISLKKQNTEIKLSFCIAFKEKMLTTSETSLCPFFP